MKKIILTFDDGPSENFSGLLNYLIKNNHKAIFFCLGKNLENSKYEKDLIKAIEKGFIIANHSYSHPNFNFISFRKGKEEIVKTDKLISDLYKKAGKKREIKLFRFPFFSEGLFNFYRYQKLLKSLGYENPYFKKGTKIKKQRNHFLYHFIQSLNRGKYDVYCDLDPADWEENTGWEKIKRVLSKAEDGDVIDLHDQDHNLELTKKICEYLNKRGFEMTI